MEQYKAAMVLSGTGDALGYRNQLWEYNESGPAIHQVGPTEHHAPVCTDNVGIIEPHNKEKRGSLSLYFSSGAQRAGWSAEHQG